MNPDSVPTCSSRSLSDEVVSVSKNKNMNSPVLINFEEVDTEFLTSYAASVDHTTALSTATEDLVFEKKLLANDEIPMKLDDSSLSVIDLELVDDADIFEAPKIPMPNTPVQPSTMCPLANHMECASPIPIESDIGPRITKTPFKDQSVPPQTHSSPAHLPPDQQVLSIPSSTASPIQTGSIVSSTPFHGRMLSSCSDTARSCEPNRTYNVDEQLMDVTAPVCNRKPMNVTYDEKATANNVTYTTIANNSIRNETFNKTTSHGLHSAHPNETFEVVVGTVSDSSVFASVVSPSNSESASNKTGDSSVASKQPNNGNKPKSNLRKPLSALNNTGNSRLKASSASSQSQKKVSKLKAPRMNAAALSRIQVAPPSQARSPTKLETETQDENTSAMKPPTGVSALRKTQLRKNIPVPRKSLLPPSTAKARPHTSPAKKSPSPRGTISTAPTSGQMSRGKRKLESPKRSGQASKSDIALTKSSTSSTSSTLRSNSQLASRVASSGSRQSSKLQKPQGSLIPSRPSQSSPTCVSSSESTTGRVSLSKSRGSGSRTAAKKQESSTSLKRKEQETQNVRNLHSQSVVALSTLLDYVVNRLDGLSAPKLTADKEHLQALVSNQHTSNVDLTSRLNDLETALSQSRDAHERDVREAVNRYELIVKELKENHELTERSFHEKLRELSQRLSEQESDHQRLVEELKNENKKAIEDIEIKYTEETAQLRHEWSEERAEIEKETLELKEKMNAKVQAKVEELIQPYINSYEENKSLRTVLEMKNNEHRKLELEISQQSDHLDKVRTLNDLVITLQQRNEDLQTQVADKNVEQRELKKEVNQVRRNLEEQQHVSNNQQQRIEELTYRLNADSPTPVSPFNPVFTPSPTAAGGALGSNTTPSRNKSVRARRSNDDMLTSRKRPNMSRDVGTSAQENGTT